MYINNANSKKNKSGKQITKRLIRSGGENIQPIIKENNIQTRLLL
jgi:hypothetical protein